MTKIMLRYGVPSEFIYRLPSDTKSISCPSLMEVVVYKETFRAKFYLPFYPFIERLLARHELVLVQLHLNAGRGIIDFMFKCTKEGLEPRMRVLRSVLFLKAG